MSGFDVTTKRRPDGYCLKYCIKNKKASSSCSVYNNSSPPCSCLCWHTRSRYPWRLALELVLRLYLFLRHQCPCKIAHPHLSCSSLLHGKSVELWANEMMTDKLQSVKFFLGEVCQKYGYDCIVLDEAAVIRTGCYELLYLLCRLWYWPVNNFTNVGRILVTWNGPGILRIAATCCSYFVLALKMLHANDKEPALLFECAAQTSSRTQSQRQCKPGKSPTTTPARLAPSFSGTCCSNYFIRRS